MPRILFHQNRTTILLGILLLLILACRFMDTPTATPSPLPIPKLDELIFEDPETMAHFKSLNQCIVDLASPGWHTTSFQLLGNFYESRWCSGAGVRVDCQITDGSIYNRDQQLVDLYTLFYPQEPTRVFGLGFQSLWVPEATGWGAYFSFSEKGKNIMGEGWGVSLYRYENASDPPSQTVTLGNDISYTINEETIQVDSEFPLREDLAGYLKSPEDMRDRSAELYQRLLDEIQSKLNNHEISACEYGEYQGNGIPPVCNPRPMTAEEETTEMEKARFFIEDQIQALQTQYAEMYVAWMNSFPFDTCWQ